MVAVVDSDAALLLRATKYYRWRFCRETVNRQGLEVVALNTFVTPPLMVKGHECPPSTYLLHVLYCKPGA